MNEYDLFNACRGIRDEAERARLLDRVCQDQPELRQRVEQRLAACEFTDAWSNQARSEDPHDVQRLPEACVDVTVSTGHKLRAGATIAGRYRLLEAIGEGGMGTVWIAEQREPVKRKVAIKLVKSGMDSAQVLARFEAERQALALMDHPHIAKVFDGGMTEQGRPYFVMEYVQGVPLTDYCDQARLSVRDRLNLFISICQAVQHAHQKGVIHRDLKPSNILVCLYDGRPVPKVIDFGLAKAMHQALTDRTLHTAFGLMVGTPLYMSPEQAEHNNLDVDTRTDIYSLGVILYELLTGTTPLEKQQLMQAAYGEVLRLIKEVEPPKPSTRLSGSVSLPSVAAQRSIEPHQLRKSLAGDLDWIAMKALDKDRSRRYETANALAMDIQRYLRDEPVLASPPSAAYRLRKLVWRHKWQSAAAVLVFVALLALVGAGVSLQYSGRIEQAYRSEAAARLVSEKQRAEAHQQRQHAESAYLAEQAARKMAEEQEALADTARAEATRALQLAEVYAYFHRLALADSAWKDGDIRRADQVLDECPIQQRRWEWSLLKRRNHAELRTYCGHTNLVTDLDVSPDGQTLVSASLDGTVRMWGIVDGREQQVWQDAGAPVASVAIDPTGQTVAAVTVSGQVAIWDAKNGRVSRPFAVTTAGNTSIAPIAWNPLGDSLAVASDTQLTIWDVQENRVRHEIATHHAGIIRQVAFALGGRRVATASWDGTIKLWDTTGGNLVMTIETGGSALMALASSHDGRHLASSGMDFRIHVWNAETGQLLRTLPGHEFTTRDLSFSPNERTLASASSDGTIKIWDWKEERALHTLRGHYGRLHAVAYSPNGQYLISGSEDATLKLWCASVDGEGLLAANENTFIAYNRIAFGPDGKWIARTGVGDQLQIVDAVTGAIEARSEIKLTQPLHPALGLAVHPHGHLIAVGGISGNLHVLAAPSCELLWSSPAHKGTTSALTFSPDGRWLVSGGVGELALWDLNQRQIVRMLSLPKSAIQLSNSVETPARIVLDVAFLPDSRRCISVEPKSLRLWDVTTGTLLREYPIGESAELCAAAVNADGLRLAAADDQGGVTIWDLEQAQVLHRLRGHAGSARDVSFSPDGTRFVSVGADRRVKLWDTALGYELVTLHGLINQGSSVTFDPTGQLLAVSDDAKTLRIWAANEPETEVNRLAWAESRYRVRQQSTIWWAASNGDWATVDWHVRQLSAVQSRETPPAIYLASQVAARAGALGESGDHATAADECRRALEIQQALAASFPGTPAYEIEVSTIQMLLGATIQDGGDPVESVKWFDSAITTLRQLRERNADNPSTLLLIVSAYSLRAQALLRQGKFAEAAAQWNEVIENCGPEQRAWANFNLGSVLARSGQSAEAEEAFDRGFALREKVAVEAGPDAQKPHWLVAVYQMDRAIFYQQHERFGEAIEWFARAGRALEEFEKKWPGLEVTNQLRWAHENRAACLVCAGRGGEAVDDYDKALAYCPAADRISLRIIRATAWMRGGRVDDALAEIEGLTQSKNLSVVEAYNLACFYAVASAGVTEKRDAFAGLAVEYLRQAVQEGWKDEAHIAKDIDLESLRDRPDFQELLRSMVDAETGQGDAASQPQSPAAPALGTTSPGTTSPGHDVDTVEQQRK
jgi:WD40 repeat protein/serine/threonine protein kinase/tetratricopeptide (TPR) repeat protein